MAPDPEPLSAPMRAICRPENGSYRRAQSPAPSGSLETFISPPSNMDRNRNVDEDEVHIPG